MEKIYLCLDRISNDLNQLMKVLSGIMLIAMTIVITIQILFRIFFSALSYTEEVSRYLLVWSSLFAASVAYKQGSHIAVTFLVERCKNNFKRIMPIMICLLSSLFFIAAIYYGFQLIHMQVFQTSPALLIPMRYVYLCIPISFLVMLFHSLVMLWGKVNHSSQGVKM